MKSHEYAKLLLGGPDLPITQNGCGPYYPPSIAKRQIHDLGEFIVIGKMPDDGEFIFTPNVKPQGGDSGVFQ